MTTDTQQYWTDRKNRMDAEIAADKQYSSERPARLHALTIELNGIEPHRTDRIAELESQIAAIKTEIAAEVAAEWTVEVTTQRRQAWNALVKSGKISKGGKVDMVAMRNAERNQGWTVDALKAAVARLGL